MRCQNWLGVLLISSETRRFWLFAKRNSLGAWKKWRFFKREPKMLHLFWLQFICWIDVSDVCREERSIRGGWKLLKKVLLKMITVSSKTREVAEILGRKDGALHAKWKRLDDFWDVAWLSITWPVCSLINWRSKFKSRNLLSF